MQENLNFQGNVWYIGIGMCFGSILFIVKPTKLELVFALGTMSAIIHSPVLN